MKAFLSIASTLLVLGLFGSVKAERLRISPDDLRLRVAVSEQLPQSLRHELRDLAASTPLPLRDGVLQTKQLMQDRFANRGWAEERQLLATYYFLVARLEQSQIFSDEFLRRRQLVAKGRSLLDDYINELNREIARAVYNDTPPIELDTIQELPLERSLRNEDGSLELLHFFPPAKLSLGRNNLRKIRAVAETERALFRQRLKDLAKAEKDFLKEVSLVGNELIAMRPAVEPWVRLPGEGLPFSP